MNELTGSSKKRRRRVSFHASVTEILIGSESEVREEQWYTAQEFKLIKDYNSSLLKRMAKSSLDECIEDEDCERGLEILQPELKRKSMANRRLCISLVMQEQEMQRMVRTVASPEKLAEVYTRNSQAAKKFALTMGRQDEKFVREEIKLMP